MSTKVEIRAEPATPAELLARASALVPVLKERAAEAEQLRRLPNASVDALMASGLYRIAVPQRFGGLDADYAVALDVAEELARGCPAAGWCYGLWAAHAWLIGYWPLPAQEEVFGADPDALCSSSLNTGKSTCTPVDGGYRVTGRWEFSSGCDFATWLMLGVSGIGERNWVLIPRSDFEIIDTWFVSGLRGSGSKDIVVTDAFVPPHRVLDVPTAGDGDYSGWDVHRQSRYRAPITVLLGWDLVAPLLGIAQGMIDEFIARIDRHVRPGPLRRFSRQSTCASRKPAPRSTPPAPWCARTCARSWTAPNPDSRTRLWTVPGTAATRPTRSNCASRPLTGSSTSAAATPFSIRKRCNVSTATPTPPPTATP